MSPYELSLQDWVKASKTAEDWRKAGTGLWTKIMTGEHYHNGRTCSEVHCPNGLKQRPVITPKLATATSPTGPAS